MLGNCKIACFTTVFNPSKAIRVKKTEYHVPQNMLLGGNYNIACFTTVFNPSKAIGVKKTDYYVPQSVIFGVIITSLYNN